MNEVLLMFQSQYVILSRMSTENKQEKVRPFFRFLAFLIVALNFYLLFTLSFLFFEHGTIEDKRLFVLIIFTCGIFLWQLIPIVVIGNPVWPLKIRSRENISFLTAVKTIGWRFPLLGLILGGLFSLTIPSKPEELFRLFVTG
jgi:hypothetical protein